MTGHILNNSDKLDKVHSAEIIFTSDDQKYFDKDPGRGKTDPQRDMSLYHCEKTTDGFKLPQSCMDKFTSVTAALDYLARR